MATFDGLQEKVIRSGQNPEKIKNAAEVLGEFALGMVPLLWIPDIKKGLENARTYSDFVFYTSSIVLFAAMDVSDIVSLGGSAIATASAKIMLRKAAKNFTEVLIKNGVEKEVAESVVKDIIKTAEKQLDDVGEFLTKQEYVIKEIIKKNNIKTTEELVDYFKGQFIKKQDSALYKILDGAVTGVPSQEKIRIFRELENTKEIGIGIIDKSSTYLLNGLSNELGDAGLSIYMKNLLENARSHGVELIMTGADEVVVIAREGGEETVRKFFASVKAGMEKDIKAIKELMPNNSAVSYFEDALAGISLHVDTAYPKIINGRVMISSKHSPKNYVNLSKFTSNMETRKLFKGMDAADVKRLRPFTNLSGGIVESISQPSGVIAVRLGFDEATNKSLKVLTEKAGKGTAQTLIENGIGPSVINLLGHPAADYFTYMYTRALKQAFEKAGKKDILQKVGQVGAPLSVGYVLKEGAELSTKEIDAITKSANEIFVNMIKKEQPELGLIGVKAVNGLTKEAVEKELLKEVTKGLSEAIQNQHVLNEIWASVVVLHMPALKRNEIALLKNHLASIGIKGMEIERLDNLLINMPNWVRRPEDLFIYLKINNIDVKMINSVMGFFGGMSIW